MPKSLTLAQVPKARSQWSFRVPSACKCPYFDVSTLSVISCLNNRSKSVYPGAAWTTCRISGQDNWLGITENPHPTVYKPLETDRVLSCYPSMALPTEIYCSIIREDLGSGGFQHIHSYRRVAPGRNSPYTRVLVDKNSPLSRLRSIPGYHRTVRLRNCYVLLI